MSRGVHPGEPEAPGDSATGSARFIWPPIEPPRAWRDEPGSKPLTGALGRMPDTLGAFESIEHDWLGVRSVSFARLALRCGWVMDHASVYCGRCGGNVGPHEATDEGCAGCRGVKMPWDGFIRLGEYGGPVAWALRTSKFRRWPRLGREVGYELGAALYDRLGGSPKVVIVPVPTHWARRAVRGVDHTLELARGVASVTPWRVRRPLRRRYRPSQLDVSPSERISNATNSCRVVDRRFPRDASAIVVVDDVRTSGSTLRDACLRLREAGRRADWRRPIFAAAAAVTPSGLDDGRSHALSWVGRA